MLVVADLEEVFVPLQEGLFVDPIARRCSISFTNSFTLTETDSDM